MHIFYNKKKEQRQHIEMLSSYLDKNLDQANMSLEMAKRARWQQKPNFRRT